MIHSVKRLFKVSEYSSTMFFLLSAAVDVDSINYKAACPVDILDLVFLVSWKIEIEVQLVYN